MRMNWKIGPRARRRLAEMAKAGLIFQVLSQDADGVMVSVELDGSCVDRQRFESVGDTIGLAVGQVYAEWKKKSE